MDREHIPSAILSDMRITNAKEEVDVALRGDLGDDGAFGETWFIAANNTLAIYCVRNGKPVRAYEYAIKKIKEISLVSLAGSGAIDVDDGKHRARVMFFSNALYHEFGEAVEEVKRLTEGKPCNKERLAQSRTVCERCGKRVPHGETSCPYCTDRKGTFFRLMQFSGAYKKSLILLFFIMICSTLLGLATPYMSKIFIDVVFKPVDASVTPPVFHEKSYTWFLFTVLALFIAYTGQQILFSLHVRTSGKLGHKAVYDVRAMVYKKIQELSMSFFDKHQVGSLISRVNQDTAELQRLLIDVIPITFESVFTLVGVGILLFVLSWKLTLFVAIPLAFTIFFFKNVFLRIIRYWERWMHKRSRVTAQISDSLSGMRVIKSFGQENLEMEKFDRVSSQYRDAGISLETKWSVYMPMLQFFIMSGSVIVWLVGGHLIFDHTMTLGSVVAYAGYLMLFYRPVFMLTRMMQIATNSLSAAERIFDVIDTEPEIMDSENALAMPKIKGEVVFENVTFGYNRFTPVIKNLSLTIKPNERVGFVGKSGVGKSTIINLILRLYDVNKGAITIDGVNIKDIRYSDLRKQIGVVLQETFLFSGSIYDNIAYARPNATRDEVIEAARAANAHTFIMMKPDAYDTDVGERGNKLSGGEKQRIAIARAILRDPAILILDEATSSVDTETEKAIQDALHRLTENRTTIAIAHRLSTLRESDRLFVIEDGNLVETGTHAALMKKKGVFYGLVTMQKEMSRVVAVKG